ncbi:hypothetical protein E3N88_26866 [Mikania micrantha]|uniref:Myb-like domain-containing protein n=1 Tax=Mikania micrantha TaxID=192012 RepID=A0A5N6MXR2_9ASTR|nr:hypothetical protein E3N88_26866 [Mikania micrantha]
MSSAGVKKPVRKFPLPCWTPDEALVLIGAYRERWYALNRAFLHAADWDAVAEKVTTTCPDVTPPKTAAQCRHKMEKLRQRHRVEKKRSAAFFDERFISTWFYYEAMEAMENGSNIEPGSLNPGPGILVKSLAPKSTKRRIEPNPNFGKFSSIISNQEAQIFVETPIKETLTLKHHKKISVAGGIRIKPSITTQEESCLPDIRPRKFSKVVHGNEDDDNGEMWIKVPRRTDLSRGKWRNENNPVLNGKNLRKKEKDSGGIADVVASIKLLGEGFMKVEKMKIDMAMEIEQMRIETEMKRNRLMLESQKQIVEAFVEGLIQSRKVSTTMADL